MLEGIEIYPLFFRMGVKMKIQFSGRVTATLNKYKVKQEIINAIESSPELRKQIRQVFHTANRRIQNVEATGLYSPAVAALNKYESGFSKFSMRGDWQTLKEEYAKAVAFLNQPTSTATGTREYCEAIKTRYDLTDDEFKGLSDNFLGKLNSLSTSSFVENYMKRYKDFTGDFEQSAKSSASQMESEAVQIENALQQQINEQAEEVTEQLEDYLEDVSQSIIDMLKGFNI